jgi:hypothetical protein
MSGASSVASWDKPVLDSRRLPLAPCRLSGRELPFTLASSGRVQVFSWLARVVRVAFDFEHEQRRAAPSAIEPHPVLRFVGVCEGALYATAAPVA